MTTVVRSYRAIPGPLAVTYGVASMVLLPITLLAVAVVTAFFLAVLLIKGVLAVRRQHAARRAMMSASAPTKEEP